MAKSHHNDHRHRSHSSHRSHRRRPSYVASFIDHLRQFHDTQARFVPARLGRQQQLQQPRQPLLLPPSPPQQPPTLHPPQPLPPSQFQQTAARLIQKQNVAEQSRKAFQSMAPSEPSAKSVTTSKYLSRPPSESTTSEPSSSRQDRSISKGRQSYPSNEQGSHPVETISQSEATHPTSELFRQKSPMQQATDQASPPESTGPVAPLAQFVERPLPLPSISKGETSTAQALSIAAPQTLLPPTSQNLSPTLLSPPQPRPPNQDDIQNVQKQLELLQMQKLAASRRAPGPPAQLTSLASSPATKSVKIFVKSTKDSADPSLTQTPAAAVGGSSYAAQQQQIHPSSQDRIQIINGKAVRVSTQTPVSPLSDEQKKKISLSRTIAEQTPNAIRTLGPGFQISMPGEKSKPEAPKNKTNTAGNLETVPSDYEHIYHYASNIADERPPQHKSPVQSPRRKVPANSPKQLMKNINNNSTLKYPHQPPVARAKQLNLPQVGNKTLKRQEDKRITKRRASPVAKKTK